MLWLRNAKTAFMHNTFNSGTIIIVLLPTSLKTEPLCRPSTVNMYSAVLYVRLVRQAWILNASNATCSTKLHYAMHV